MNEALLIAALRERGLIAADAAAPAAQAEGRPWFISLLLGLAGWLAGIFALGFIGLAFGMRDTSQLLVVGVLLLGTAWGLYAAARTMVFVDQLALAFSIAGQLAVAGFCFEKLDSVLLATTAILLMQLVLFAVPPDRLARTIAAFFACIAWTFVMRFALRPGPDGSLFIDSNPHFTLPWFGAWTLPVEWLLTWMPLIALLVWLVRTEARWMARSSSSLARPAITGLLLGLALGGVGGGLMSQIGFGIDSMSLKFNWWALFPLLSITLAMFAAFYAFRLRSNALAGVSVVAALGQLARFYYLYGTTLMWKSLIMLIVGVVLLAAGVLLTRRVTEAKP